MKSSYIYINPQGVPCAPMSGLNDAYNPLLWSDTWTEKTGEVERLKQSAIPIREEDQHLLPKIKGIQRDIFIPIDPYEFDIVSVMGYDSQFIDGDLKSEYKQIQVARIIRPPESKNFFDVYPNGIIGERDPLTPEDEAKRQAEWRKNFIAIQNQLIADGALATIPESKADPKEKELYSIKDLEWVDDAIISHVRTPFGTYRTLQVRLDTWSCGMYFEGILDEVVNNNCRSLDHAKRQAQDHFNSKLKLCLNREL